MYVPNKPIFILYLIISSFALTTCSKIKDNYILNKINEKIHKTYEETKEYLHILAITYLIDSLSNPLSLIGNKIYILTSHIYESLIVTLGPTVTSWVVIGGFVVVFIGACYIIFKVVNSNHYVKIKKGDLEFEYRYNATNY